MEKWKAGGGGGGASPRRAADSFTQDAQCKHIEKKCETFMMCTREVGRSAAMRNFYSTAQKENMYKYI